MPWRFLKPREVVRPGAKPFKFNVGAAWAAYNSGHYQSSSSKRHPLEKYSGQRAARVQLRTSQFGQVDIS